MLNEVRLIGNLADDPEKSKAKATAFTKFVVIHNNRQTSQKAVIEVVAFARVAALTASLRKGRQVLVIGRLQTNQWQDKDSGEPRTKTNIVANLVIPVEQPKQQN